MDIGNSKNYLGIKKDIIQYNDVVDRQLTVLGCILFEQVVLEYI